MKKNKNSFLKFLKSTKPRIGFLFLGLIISVFTTIIGLFIPQMMRFFVDLKDPSKFSTLYIGLGVSVFILSAIFSGISGFLLRYVGEDVVKKLRERIWSKLLNLPVRFYDDNKTGEITSRLINDTTQVKSLVGRSIPNFIVAILQIIGALIFLLSMDWTMTSLILIVIPIIVLILFPIGRKMSKIGKKTQDFVSEFNGDTSEILSEIRLVKSSNAEKFEKNEGDNNIKRLFKISLKEAKFDSLVGPIMGTIMTSLFVLILSYGAMRVNNGTMSSGTLVAFLMYLFQITSPTTVIASFFTDLNKAKGSTERIVDLLQEDSEDLNAGIDFDVTGKELTFDSVNFSYKKDEKNILEDISFTAKTNKITAFAGPSGGGKSTIFSLIERFYSPSSGEIKIGNENISDISLNSWRNQVGIVSQDSAILDGTIRENLVYGLERKVSDEDIWKALDLAYASEFVKKMDNQLDTEVGEKGVKISGGQKQRISIARAFLRDSRILMLDEATASLDSESEAYVQKALNNLMKGRMTLVIAHRLSTIVDSDEILFIENGKITGRGTHLELLKSHPLYKTYVDGQFIKDDEKE